MGFDHTGKLGGLVLHVAQDPANGEAGDRFLDVKAVRFIGIQVDVGLVHGSEEVVQVSHDILVGTEKEKAEEVGLTVEGVKGKAGASAGAIDEVVDFTIRVAGDIDQTPVLGRGFMEAMDRNDREELFEGPVVDERLKDTKVTEVLAAELLLKFSYFFGWGATILVKTRDLGDEMPEGVFHAGFGGKIKEAQVEPRGGLFLDGQAIVQRFAAIFSGEIENEVGELANEFRIFLFGGNEGARSFIDGAKNLHQENGVVGDGGAPALTDESGVRNFFLAANLGDGANNITGVFGQGVVHGAFRVATGSIIVDREATPDVEVGRFEAEMVKLGIEAGGFANGSAQGENIGDLGADVEVEHLQGLGTTLFAEVFDGFEKFAGGETEFGIVSTREGPFSDSAGGEANTDTDKKLHLHGAGGFHGQSEFFGFFNHQDDFFAQFPAEQSRSDKLRVFVPVADEKTFGIAMVGETGKEFRLTANLQAKVKGLSRVENFLHYLPHLVDLDWKNTSVTAFVAGGFDGVGEGFVNRADTVPKQIVETNEERVVETPLTGASGDFDEINFGASSVHGSHGHVSRWVDAKVATAPTRDAVGGEGAVDRPRFDRFGHEQLSIRPV